MSGPLTTRSHAFAARRGDTVAGSAAFVLSAWDKRLKLWHTYLADSPPNRVTKRCQTRLQSRPSKRCHEPSQGNKKPPDQGFFPGFQRFVVELRGFEPLTPCMPCRCATSCAIAPYFLRFLRGNPVEATRLV